MRPSLVPVAELARAVAEARKTARGETHVSLVSVSTKNWEAHIPRDSPAPVKSLAIRLMAQ
jgi:hypothetical protein